MWDVRRNVPVSLVKSFQAAGNKIFPLEKLCPLYHGFTCPLEGHALPGNFYFWRHCALTIQETLLLTIISSQNISIFSLVFGLKNLSYARDQNWQKRIRNETPFPTQRIL